MSGPPPAPLLHTVLPRPAKGVAYSDLDNDVIVACLALCVHVCGLRGGGVCLLWCMCV